MQDDHHPPLETTDCSALEKDDLYDRQIRLWGHSAQ